MLSGCNDANSGMAPSGGSERKTPTASSNSSDVAKKAKYLIVAVSIGYERMLSWIPVSLRSQFGAVVFRSE